MIPYSHLARKGYYDTIAQKCEIIQVSEGVSPFVYPYSRGIHS